MLLKQEKKLCEAKCHGEDVGAKKLVCKILFPTISILKTPGRRGGRPVTFLHTNIYETIEKWSSEWNTQVLQNTEQNGERTGRRDVVRRGPNDRKYLRFSHRRTPSTPLITAARRNEANAIRSAIWERGVGHRRSSRRK